MVTTGILTNVTYAKFATEVKSIEEQVNLKQAMSEEKYSGSINDLLGINSTFNNKVLIEDDELKYIQDNISLQEANWFEKLGIEKCSDYYTIEFDTAGSNEEVQKQLIRAGKLAHKPNDPKKEGYDFLGWFYIQETGAGTNTIYTEIAFDFDKPISKNYLLYAKYAGEAIMMAHDNQAAFWSEDYKNKITNIYFKKGDLTVPNTSIKYWNIRADNNCSDIIAYIENNTDDDNYSLTIISNKLIYSNISMASFFSDFIVLRKIDFSNLDTSKTHNMTNLFYNCTNISELNLETFNTKNVTTMHGMFWNCKNLSNLNISGFDTSNVNNMKYLFNNCANLSEIDIRNFDTSNVTTMRQMFTNCSSFISLDLSSFNTAKVTDMAAMFQSCNNLREIFVGQSWNIDNVIDFRNMYLGCGTDNVTQKE